MPLLWWLVVISLLFISFIFFLKRPQLAKIAYLDKKLWSLAYQAPDARCRGKILRIVDYQIFIVIYFEGHKTLTSIIWFDQMSLAEWKKLKTLEKLY